MKTIAITKKVILELLRDKRTLLLMFLAPIMIMFLLNVMFSVESKTEVKLATLGLKPEMVTLLKRSESIHLKEYDSIERAKKSLKDGDVDTLIEQKGNTYQVTYANTDVSKTQNSRQALKQALMLYQFQSLKQKLKQLSGLRPGLTLKKEPTNDKQTIKESYRYGNKDTGFFAKMMPVLIGFLTFFFVFLISGMALLKERTSGTLDRLLASPVKRSDIVFGYMMAYGLLAIFQTSVIVISAIYLLHLEVKGSLLDILLVTESLALVALAFGILLSTLAKSEFQMMQFIPLVVLPQFFFSGLIPLDSMASWVKVVGKVLPLSYSGHALSAIILEGKGIEAFWKDILVLLFLLILLTLANIVGLKRYRKV
ncbi:ABC transporter permease [Streptococcus uberis]|uniref:ABC transporter permease n=1 Tax=Streptococcus uberis TaxID=1349 RepID=UPI0012B60FC0|nr:ABC transporter permease [Streptococcus uberis]MTB61632.1 ABC transporter permease subunit [Streptococcus uberis]MTB91636.1 ABC transporter permease subunit [Streptococcus uberis]